MGKNLVDGSEANWKLIPRENISICLLTLTKKSTVQMSLIFT